jgi:hypothetical protein
LAFTGLADHGGGEGLPKTDALFAKMKSTSVAENVANLNFDIANPLISVFMQRTFHN